MIMLVKTLLGEADLLASSTELDAKQTWDFVNHTSAKIENENDNGIG